MSNRRNGLKAIGLSFLAVLGLMAFMAGGAQANWLAELEAGKELKALTTNETVAASAHTVGKLAVAAKKIEFRCTTLASSGLKLVASSVTAEGKVSFTGCKAFSPIGSETEQKNCKPVEPIVAGGKALVVLHETKNFVLFEPETTGGVFTTVEVPELCALTETSKVTGSLVAECLTFATLAKSDCKVGEVTHLIQPTPAGLFPADVLKFGASEATLAGVAATKLSGALATRSWAGHV